MPPLAALRLIGECASAPRIDDYRARAKRATEEEFRSFASGISGHGRDAA